MPLGGLKIGMDFKAVKGMFFDREKVKSAVGKATRRMLSKFGAYVRTRARSSIRKKKGPSAPGRPPHSHTGLLRRFIFFAFEPRKETVVIGPVRLGSKSPYGPTTVPEVLEYGGAALQASKRGRSKVLRFPERPYMGPAFEAEKEESLPALWRDCVR